MCSCICYFSFACVQLLVNYFTIVDSSTGAIKHYIHSWWLGSYIAYHAHWFSALCKGFNICYFLSINFHNSHLKIIIFLILAWLLQHCKIRQDPPNKNYGGRKNVQWKIDQRLLSQGN